MHILNLKLFVHRISNISQHTLIFVIKTELHCFILSLLISHRFQPPIAHMGWIAKGTFLYFVSTFTPFRFNGRTFNLRICICPCNVEDFLITCVFKNIQGHVTMVAWPWLKPTLHIRFWKFHCKVFLHHCRVWLSWHQEIDFVKVMRIY